MHYFEGFAPVVLLCELSMMLVAALAGVLWLGALGEAGKRLRGCTMLCLIVGTAWVLWQSDGPERISAHVRFALQRDHYQESVVAWQTDTRRLPEGTIAEGDRLYFPWSDAKATTQVDYGVVYDLDGDVVGEGGRVFPLHQGWYFRLRD